MKELKETATTVGAIARAFWRLVSGLGAQKCALYFLCQKT